MIFYLIKLFVSAGLIVVITEVSKVNTTVGGLIKSLPLVSLLAMIWLYIDTKDVRMISILSMSTIWFVIPTLPMFAVLSQLLNHGVNFYLSLSASVAVMLIGYVITAKIVRL